MKALLAKLLGMFHTPEPAKPVEPWPFPKEEVVKAPAKKRIAAKPKKAAVKNAPAVAKKTAAKKTTTKKAKK